MEAFRVGTEVLRYDGRMDEDPVSLTQAQSDEALLRLVAAEDELALGSLYDRYGASAYSLACRILGDRHAAEDVVQEAFLNIWRKAGSFDEQRGAARSWMLSIVHHGAIDTYRRRRNQLPVDSLPDFRQPATAPGEVWNQVALRLDWQAAHKALGQLPIEQREAIELAYFGGYTGREISEIKDLPLGTVKGRIRIGMEKLRNLLKCQMDGVRDV